MKRIFSIIVFTIIILYGCSESFLDRQPEDEFTFSSFYKNTTEIKAGLVSVYKPLQTIYNQGGVLTIVENMADDGTRPFANTAYNDFFKDNTSSGDFASSSNKNAWYQYYRVIVGANNIISVIDNFVPPTKADSALVKVFKGEASFLRAFAYFNLVRLYGDVPKVTERISEPSKAFGLGRTSVQSIYTDVIIPDLQYAIANCYKKGDAGLSGEGARVTKGSALIILGEVYLTMHQYSDALAVLRRLICSKEGGNYSLVSNYANIWLPTNKFNSESIFEVNYNVAAGMPSYYYRNMSSVGANKYLVSTISCQYTGCKNLMDEFVAYKEWTRYKVSLDSGWHAMNNLITPIPLKNMPPLNVNTLKGYNNTGTDYNFMISRYSDALLMYAEAHMQLGTLDSAAYYINLVRKRVNMAVITTADVNIDRILHERRMELTFEGHRYFDLVRTGKAIEYISKDLMSHVDYEGRMFRTSPIVATQLILPVPVTEIQKDQTLTQNPGY